MAEQLLYTLGYDEFVSVEKTLTIKYAEFTYITNQSSGSNRILVSHTRSPADTSQRFQVTPENYDDEIMLICRDMGLGGSDIRTSTVTYYPGMKWKVVFNHDTEVVTITLPDGTIETFPSDSSYFPNYIEDVDSDLYAQGTFLFNDTGPGPVWESESSETGGGEGDADQTTDDIATPSLPTISALNTSMIKMYNPSLGELTSLAGFLWSSSFVDNVVKTFQDPMEALVGLSMVYITPTTGVSEQMYIGKVASGVNALPVTNQFVTLDCGSISVNEYWGNALDYDPHTKAQIYLPFIGTQTISVDDIMGGSLNVKYNIDLLTGACMCFLTTTRGDLDSVLYSFSGNISAQIPLSGRDMSSVVSSIVGIVASAGLTYATGGASAPLVAGSAMSMLNAKSHVQKSGRLDSSVGVLGIKKPYLIITRPVQSLAENYNSYRGYPSNITKSLNDLTGYTEVETVYMKGITATQEEIELIEAQLKQGVIL